MVFFINRQPGGFRDLILPGASFGFDINNFFFGGGVHVLCPVMWGFMEDM